MGKKKIYSNFILLVALCVIVSGSGVVGVGDKGGIKTLSRGDVKGGMIRMSTQHVTLPDGM